MTVIFSQYALNMTVSFKDARSLVYDSVLIQSANLHYFTETWLCGSVLMANGRSTAEAGRPEETGQCT